jgi:hypothetical protein
VEAEDVVCELRSDWGLDHRADSYIFTRRNGIIKPIENTVNRYDHFGLWEMVGRVRPFGIFV